MKQASRTSLSSTMPKTPQTSNLVCRPRTVKGNEVGNKMQGQTQQTIKDNDSNMQHQRQSDMPDGRVTKNNDYNYDDGCDVDYDDAYVEEQQTDYLITLLGIFPQVPHPLPPMTQDGEFRPVSGWPESDVVAGIKDVNGLVAQLNRHLRNGGGGGKGGFGDRGVTKSSSLYGAYEEQILLIAESTTRQCVHQSTHYQPASPGITGQ